MVTHWVPGLNNFESSLGYGHTSGLGFRSLPSGRSLNAVRAVGGVLIGIW